MLTTTTDHGTMIPHLARPISIRFQSGEISGWLRSVKSSENVKIQGFSSWILKATRNGVH